MSTRQYALPLMAMVLALAMPVFPATRKGSPEPAPENSARASGSRNAPTAVASSSAAAPDQIVDPGRFDRELMERLVFAKSNEARRKYSRRALAHSLVLARAARGHSRDMAERGYFSHTSGNLMHRQGLVERIQAAGGRHTACAENIAMVPVAKQFTGKWVEDSNGHRSKMQWEAHNRSYDQIAADAVQMWLDSPGHRKNLLRTEMNTLGIGCWIGMKKGVPYVYLTQDFATE